MTARKVIFLLIPIVAIITLICFGFTRAGDTAALDLNGIGVDSSGQIYIGRLHKIEIYNNGQKVDAIDVPEYRAWNFCIRENTIFLSDSVTIYKMDLNGQVLSQEDDVRSGLYREIEDQKVIEGCDGKTYKTEKPFGWTELRDENGTIVYKISAADYFARIGFYLPVLFLLIAIPILKKSSGKNIPEADGTEDS